MSGYSFERLKVLVIDDNQHMRALLDAILQAFGIKTVYQADNARSGWDILAHSACDIVFVDWVMDGPSGLEFTERVRSGPDSPNPFVPIVMLTGHSNLEKVHAARDAGVNEFLAKPVSPKSILTRLVSIIEYPRPFVRTKVYFGPCRRRRRDAAYRGTERRNGELASLENSSVSAA